MTEGPISNDIAQGVARCSVCFSELPCRNHPSPPKLSFAGGTDLDKTPSNLNGETPQRAEARDSSPADDPGCSKHDHGWPARDSPVAPSACAGANQVRPEAQSALLRPLSVRADEVQPGKPEVPPEVIAASNRLADDYISKYPVESIQAGGQFQRGMLAGLVSAFEVIVGDERAAGDARIIAAEALLKRMSSELGDGSAPTSSGSNVVHFGESKLDIPPERVLQGAIGHGMQIAIVVGYDKTGGEYFAYSTGDIHMLNWLLDRAKLNVMDNYEDQFGE